MHYGCIMDVDMLAILAIYFSYIFVFVLGGGLCQFHKGPIWLFL